MWFTSSSVVFFNYLCTPTLTTDGNTCIKLYFFIPSKKITSAVTSQRMYKCDNCHYKLTIYLLIYSDRLYEFHLWSVACESQPNIVMVWLLKDNSMFGITVKDWFALSDYVLGCNFYHYCIKIKNTETCWALQQLVDWITSHTVQNSMLPVKYGRLRCYLWIFLTNGRDNLFHAFRVLLSVSSGSCQSLEPSLFFLPW